MRVTSGCIELLHHFEKCWKPDGKGNFMSYPDGRGIWTIGWGSTFYTNGKRVAPGDVRTKAQVDALFEADLKKFSDGVKYLLGTRNLSVNKFGALVSFAYNVGLDIDQDTKAEGLGDSTLLKKITANPLDMSIRDEFIKWRSKGTVNEKGLLRRRLSEWHYYLTGEVKTSWDKEIKEIMSKN